MAGTTARGWPYPTGADPFNADGDMQALAAAIDADVTALGTWTAFTPTWTAVTTNPVLGNGVRNGRYRLNAKTVELIIELTMGTTTTFGTGRWIFALPPAVTAAYNASLSAVAVDASAGTAWGGSARVEAAATTVGAIYLTDGSTGVAATNPFTWATGDVLVITGMLEKT